jgi:hypothetical protein
MTSKIVETGFTPEEAELILTSFCTPVKILRGHYFSFSHHLPVDGV